MQTLNYDVVVVGAGSAGVASALASSRTGSKTLLVERKACFGGEATNSWVSAYCGFYTKGEVPTQCVKGIGDEVLTRLKEYGEDVNYVVNPSTKNASVRFHPEVVKLVLDDMMMESSVDCRLCTSLIDVEVVDNKIVSITIMDDEDKYKVYAKSFIDTTGDANLIHLANIETMWGNEEFGIQQSSLSCLIEGVPKEEIKIETLEAAIKKGKENGIKYLDKERGMIIKVKGDDYGYLTIPSVIIDNLSGKELTLKHVELRKKALAYAKTIKEYAEGFKNTRLMATAPYIGIRESRRMIGQTIIKGKDVLKATKSTDTIARAGWPVEVHKLSGLEYHELKDNDYYGIPLSALISKDISNLFSAGRCISCDSIALASLRVMGTSFATGQASGVAAAYYAKNGVIEVTEIQEILKQQNALI